MSDIHRLYRNWSLSDTLMRTSTSLSEKKATNTHMEERDSKLETCRRHMRLLKHTQVEDARERAEAHTDGGSENNGEEIHRARERGKQNTHTWRIQTREERMSRGWYKKGESGNSHE